jgi:hypothetical protein
MLWRRDGQWKASEGKGRSLFDYSQTINRTQMGLASLRGLLVP